MSFKLSRPNYAISRIDQPEKNHHGWFVRIQIDGSIRSKFFADSKHRSQVAAQKAARRYRDELIEQLPPERLARLKQRPREVPQSGVKGITHVQVRLLSGLRDFWQVAWRDEDGVRRTRKFDIAEHGPRKALKMAKAFSENGNADTPARKQSRPRPRSGRGS